MRIGGVLKRLARDAEMNGVYLHDARALYEWAQQQQRLLEPHRHRAPLASTKVPVVRRYLHFMEEVAARDVVTVPGSSEASNIVPFNNGRRVLFQRMSCTCAACNMSEPDPTGCTFPHLTQNAEHAIRVRD